MKYLFLITFIVFSVKAQESKYFTITPKFKQDNLRLNEIYTLEKDTLIITNLKFYISNLRYYNCDSLVYTSAKRAHLIDLASSKSLQIIKETMIEYDKIVFNIGIDSITNVSGVFDEDLDPLNGMYWTWQSGYINFKLEGNATNCPARSNKFYLHIGGYLEPFYAMREIELHCNSNKPIEIFIQLDELLRNIDISKVYNVMSPNEKAIKIADDLPKIFKIVKE